MDFDYTVSTSKNFDKAVLDTEQEITEVGMRVLYTHDIQKKLAEKGIKREPFKIIEFCNAKYANEFLNADIKIGLCMPCKINVYIKEGETFISGLRPVIIPQFFPQADFGNKPQEIDELIQTIINKAK